MLNKKFITSVALIVLALHLMYFLYNFSKFNGMMLSYIGEHDGYQYAFKYPPNPAVYRDDLNKPGIKYEKVLDRSLLSKDLVFFEGNDMIFNSKERTIIKLNLSTLDFVESKVNNNKFLLKNLNLQYIVVLDLDEKDTVLILSRDSLEVVDNLNVSGINFVISETILKFSDKEFELNNMSYIYDFNSKELIIKK